jgi:hypothetical protein
MKTVIKTTSAGQKLGLLTAMITLLGGIAVGAPPGLIVNETFDPPILIPPWGWEGGGVADISREYVSEGVKGSTAAKLSTTFTDADGFVGFVLYENGGVQGNDLATPENTVLSFDLKVDQPGLTDVYVYLVSYDGYLATGSQAYSWGFIPLGSYTPGEFKTVVVPLDDQLWHASAAGPFDPSGKSYRIQVVVGAWFMPTLGPLAITIDNLRLSTENQITMVPWTSTSTGQITFTSPTTATVLEVGSAAHLGDYTAAMTLNVSETVTGMVELTADNGDRLFGLLYGVSMEPTRIRVVIVNGTGRFEGATGSYLETLTWSEYLSSFTATATGSISRVGSSE